MKIAYSGYFEERSGYGEAARRTVMALQSVNADVRVGLALRAGDPPAELTESIREFLRVGPHEQPDVHLIHAFARDFVALPRLANKLIGLTCWETDRLPESYLVGAKAADLVLVPSDENYCLFVKHGIPTELVPYPILDLPKMTRIPQLDSLESGHVLFAAIGSWQKRKNLDGVVTAFMTAEWGAIQAALVLVVGGNFGVQAATGEIAYLIQALNLPEPRPKIVLLSGLLDGQLSWLYQTVTGVISLSRGEGFCFPVADAVRGGRQIIATNWGGHLQVLHDTAGRLHGGVSLVESRLTPVTQSYPLFDGRMCWADPDLLEARRLIVQAAQAGPIRYERDLAWFHPSTIGSKIVRCCEEVLGGH